MQDWDALYAAARLEMGAARGLRLRAKPFRVQFRPFAGVRSTIVDQGGQFEVRVSDLLRDAPGVVHAALAKLLVGKLDRRLRSWREERAPYLAWSRTPDVVARHDALRRQRGRKRFGPPRGRVHDLDPLFDGLNATYFAGALPKPRLGWSLATSRRLYGHHDPVHDAIVINRRLDHPRVPTYVVEDILHHEMLHIRHGVRFGPGGRRVLHPRAFRQDEQRYAHHAAAKRWLNDLETHRIRLRAPKVAPPEPVPPSRPSSTLRSWLQGTLERWGANP